MPKLKKPTIAKMIKIVKYIEENPNTYVRDIARNLGMNPATVHRILKHLNEFLEFVSLSNRVDANLPNLPVFIRLKEGVTADGIIKFIIAKNELEL
ncbi:MAG: hypothetical protein B6U78_01050 [Candidatus Aenigmarchaeota archaeon ex4484_224]|nr:MAG: hypothetical protein B6U78_01050 [Candidatus Aenigmarchaeota archaeon ex4484_224]